MINPQKFCLSSDELLKVFPQSYYTKYANHLKILQFQKILVQKQSKKPHVNFTPRKGAYQQRIRSAISKQQQKRQRINYFDTFQDTIDKNKLQLKRMMKYNSVLGMKMRISPEKRNIIRSTGKDQIKIQDSALQNMKAIQDLQFERKETVKNKIKIQEDKKQICKFIKNYQSAKVITQKKIRVSSPLNVEGKTKAQRQLAQRLQEIAQFSLQKNENISQSVLKSKQKNALIIDNINKTIKKSHQTLRRAGMTQRQQLKAIQLFQKKILSKTTLQPQTDEQKKNILISQTRKIKKQVMSVPIFRRYHRSLGKGPLQTSQII